MQAEPAPRGLYTSGQRHKQTRTGSSSPTVRNAPYVEACAVLFRCASLSISRQGSLHDIYLLSRDQRIGWIHHDLVVSLQSSDYFNLAAEVVAGCNIGQFDLAIPYDTSLQVLRPENERADGNQKCRVHGRDVQVHFRVRAGEKSVARIQKVNLGQKCARGTVDRLGGSNDFPRKLLTREFGENDVRLGRSRLNAARILLRNIHVDTHGAGLGDVK